MKCDIKKFFDTINHNILFGIIKNVIEDEKLLNLFELIIASYHKENGKDIPLGNLTSQIFSNIYLNEFDQFIKRDLRVKYYVRYADDFVICSSSKEELCVLLDKIKVFINNKLKMKLHDEKVFVLKWHSGVDFLGYVSFPHFRLLRIKTKKRIINKINYYEKKLNNKEIPKNLFTQIIASYNSRFLYCRNKNLKKLITNKI